MCLIIAPGPDGKVALLPKDVYEYVYSGNNDGFGAMWVEDGQVKHFKGLSPDKDEEYRIMQEMTEKHPGIVFHMRYRTHGKTIPGLSHPFRLLHRSRHGYDMFFMHNGVLSSFGNNLRHGQSDTTVFKDTILLPLLTRDPDALDNEETWAAIEKLTQGSRLIFMRSDGKVWMTSKTGWNNRYGLTLSNTYMLPREYSTTNSNFQSGTARTSNGGRNSGSSTTGSTSGTGKFYDPVNGKEGTSNVYTLGVPADIASKKEDKLGQGYNICRNIITDNGASAWMFFKQVAPGYIRSEGGSLFKDRGAGLSLTMKDYIPKADELKTICADEDVVQQRVEESYVRSYPSETSIADDLDDDLPWNDGDDKGTSGVAPLGERLRYARLVHNCHNNGVTSRDQLVADLVCMDNKEFENFVKEDPGTAAVAFAEIVDIMLEFNTWLAQEPGSEDMTFDMGLAVEMGGEKRHQEAMKLISDMRRNEYEKLMQLTMMKTDVNKEKKIA